MISLTYSFDPQALAQASVVFLEKRPVLKCLNIFMALACWLIIIGFILVFFSNSVNANQIGSLVFAIIWLIGRKHFYCWLMQLRLRPKRLAKYQAHVHIHPHKLWWRTDPGGQPMEQPWKATKQIYSTANSYMVPITGFTKGGQFVWIPQNAFEHSADQKAFEEILAKHNIKIIS